MLTKQNNMADQDLVVNSIKILGDISGSGIQTIKTNVQNIQNSVQAMAAKQNDYFRSISDDGIITAAEKKTLKREWDTITQTYAAIIQMARDKQVYDTTEIQSYEAAYRNLYAEIFTIEKIFDDMYSNTNLLDKDLFNAAYDTYYSAETYAQNRISTGESFWQLRILNSLSEAGADNEVALYKGTFFRYNITSGIWEKINTSQYKGAMDHFPEATSIDDYFLSRGFSTGMKLNLKTPKETRSVEVLEGIFSDEEYRHILFNYEIKEGYLYIYSENGWEEISDRNDWRYAVAVNDLAFYGMELSPGLQQVLDNSVAKAQPEYLGSLVNPPQVYKTSDYFCWGGDDYNYQYGTRSIMLQKGRVYKFNGLEWFRLDPAVSDNNTEFMAALNDIISLNMGRDAYFNNIFLRKIFALEGVIQELSTKIITLQEQGKIVSENYKPGKKGLLLDADGNMQLDNATIIQDGNDESYALKTFGFDEKQYTIPGFGIKKNGDVIINGKIIAQKLQCRANAGDLYFINKNDKAIIDSVVYKKNTKKGFVSIAEGKIKLTITISIPGFYEDSENYQNYDGDIYVKIIRKNNNTTNEIILWHQVVNVHEAEKITYDKIIDIQIADVVFIEFNMRGSYSYHDSGYDIDKPADDIPFTFIGYSNADCNLLLSCFTRYEEFS